MTWFNGYSLLFDCCRLLFVSALWFVCVELCVCVVGLVTVFFASCC